MMPLFNDFYDQIVINVVEKNNNHFCVQFKGQDLL
jgi:hypothetical protein